MIWDIDGTILTTGGRGFPSMIRAVQEVTGLKKISENYSNTHGLTDIEVIKNLYGNEFKPLTKNEIKIILNLYEKYIDLGMANCRKRKGSPVFQITNS